MKLSSITVKSRAKNKQLKFLLLM